MKLKTFFLSILCCVLSSQAWSADAGLRLIETRGKVVCGTDKSVKTYAYKDDADIRRGIDADICRMFALAVFGESESFILQNVNRKQASALLNEGKIDLMLGNSGTTAQSEITSRLAPVDVLYYDKQIFATNTATPRGSSMNDYRGAKVCVLRNSAFEENLRAYNFRYGLEFNILPQASEQALREAFYLNRCELISGSQLYLKGLAVNPVSKNTQLSLLPEVIAVTPIYVFADKDNISLRTIGKWIINAVKLAEEHEISSKNIDSVIGVRDASLANLLGINPRLWGQFGLQTEWAKKYIKDYGNYGEIFERNIGKSSPLGLERDVNYLWNKGGLITSQPFI